jgi:hypothetical protein
MARETGPWCEVCTTAAAHQHIQRFSAGVRDALWPSATMADMSVFEEVWRQRYGGSGGGLLGGLLEGLGTL